MSNDDEEWFFISPDAGAVILGVLACICGLLIASAVGLFMAKTWARIVVIVLHSLWVLAALVSLVSDGRTSPVAVWPVVVLLLAATGRNHPAGGPAG